MFLFSDETQKLLKELTNRKPLQVPNIYHHLPHLLNNEGSLHPAVQVGLGRTGGENWIHTLQIQQKSHISWFVIALSLHCEWLFYKHSDTIVLTLGRKSGLNMFLDQLVLIKYPLVINLSKGIFVENIWWLEGTYYPFAFTFYPFLNKQNKTPDFFHSLSFCIVFVFI